MRHPTEGVLRRLLDEPAGVADADREHVAECAACLGGLAQMRDDAAIVGTALTSDVDVDGAHVDVDAAWLRLSTATPGAINRAPVTTPRRVVRLREAVRRPVVAGVAA